MKKRLISIILCLMVLLSCLLTSCGNKTKNSEDGEEADVEETSRYPMTLSLWLPTKSTTTEEAKNLVEARINVLTKAKYNTAIQLNLVPEDQYTQTIDNKLIAIDDYMNSVAEAEESRRLEILADAIAGKRSDETELETTDETAEETFETVIDTEFNQVSVVFPEVAEDQFDIFLIKGYDKYKEYKDKDLLISLDGALSSNCKKLKSYIYPTFLDVAYDEDGTYCIPNNHALGEYQFMLVNKELVKKYDYDPDELTTFVDCEDFIIDIANQKIPGVTPLLGQVEPANIVYFSIDGERSILGTQIGPGVTYKTELYPQSLLVENGSITKTIQAMKHLNELGVVGDGVLDDGEVCAVGVVKGDASLIEKYSDDYYVIKYAVPLVQVEDVFESALAVSSYTKDENRAMEIITYINTDPELRTLLQYGLEDVNYVKDVNENGEDIIHILNNDYSMSLLDSGNMFITYPGDGLPMSYWDSAKLQNQDASTNPYIGFDDYISDENKPFFETAAKMSKDIYGKMDKFTYDEFKSSIASIKQNIIKNSQIDSLIQENPTEDLADTLVFLYRTYYKSKR